MHIIYVGLDVHKDTIAVALAEGGQRGEVREHGKVANTSAGLKTLYARLARNGSQATVLLQSRPLRLWHSTSVELSSRPRSRANFPASFWRSPNKRKSQAPETSSSPLREGAHPTKPSYPKSGKAGGTVTARRTLGTTNSRILSDAGT
jgi:hypothetical protein